MHSAHPTPCAYVISKRFSTKLIPPRELTRDLRFIGGQQQRPTSEIGQNSLVSCWSLAGGLKKSKPVYLNVDQSYAAFGFLRHQVFLICRVTYLGIDVSIFVQFSREPVPLNILPCR
jgi:hypothetical protein